MNWKWSKGFKVNHGKPELSGEKYFNITHEKTNEKLLEVKVTNVKMNRKRVKLFTVTRKTVKHR